MFLKLSYEIILTVLICALGYKATVGRGSLNERGNDV